MPPPFSFSPIEAKTKGEVKRLRQAGFVPVSIQHKGTPTLHFQHKAQPFDELIHRHGDAAMLDFVITPSDQRQRAIVQKVQRHPLTQKLLQVTLQQIRADDALKTHVALVFVGEPLDVQHNKAIMQRPLDRLDIACNQDDLPDRITVNVAHLLVGDVLRVSDLPEDSRYKILTPSDTVLFSLTKPRTSAVSEETTEALPDSA